MKVNDQGVLLCPNCGGDYLHHETIEAYHRPEDQENCLKVTVSDNSLIVDSKASNADNPSERRHGLRIWFWCELCHHTSIINLAQHKGNTLIEHIDRGLDSR